MSFVETTVARRIDWADGLFTIVLEHVLERFEPGQWINVAFRDEGELVHRAYSIASAPAQEVELYLVRVDGGALTPRLFDLRPGEALLVEQEARGFFTLKHVPRARDGWLISTGTGLAPFLSMLRAGSALEHFERVVLVHGVKRAEHLAYRKDIERMLERADGRLRYVAVVSREAAVCDALAGRVTTILDDGRLEQAARLALSPHDAQVMLCGNPAMVEEMLPLLASRGLKRHRTRAPGQVTIEKYW